MAITWDGDGEAAAYTLVIPAVAGGASQQPNGGSSSGWVYRLSQHDIAVLYGFDENRAVLPVIPACVGMTGKSISPS